MYLKKISIENFRCFERLDLELHDKLTVLVAENGGGKTAILDAIAIGLSPILGSLSSAHQRLSGPGINDKDFHLIKGDEQRLSPYAKVEVQAALSNGQTLSWDVWKPSWKNLPPKDKIGHSELRKYIDTLATDLDSANQKFTPLPVFAYYGARRGYIEVPSRLRKAKENPVKYEYPTSALYGSLNAMSDFKEMLKWFDSEEGKELRIYRDSIYAANADASIKIQAFESPLLTQVRNAIKNILGGSYSNPRFNGNHKFVVTSSNGFDELQVSQLSQGYQSMLALAMDFSRRIALAHRRQLEQQQCYPSYQAPNSIMLVDEIDLHLHPSWQQRVLQDLMAAFPHTQFIVTTHSPQVLSTVPQESIRLIKGNAIYQAPAGTDGAEAQRILERVFGVSARPADSRMAKKLREYLGLVNDRQWDSERARELRQELDKWSSGEEPMLVDADLQIENMKWEMENETLP